MSSTFFKIAAIANGIIGFIAGIICGSAYPTITVEYEYPYSQRSDIISTEHFNVGLMFLIWAVFITLTLLYLAIYTHLDNQEIMYSYIKNHFEDDNKSEINNTESSDLNISNTDTVNFSVINSNNDV